ncbi:MAG: HAD family hydrolase [Fimbriimonadaceae bacterium]|nr:HAD family hydrolase [Fimbriimonadaceae bacterium]
MTGDVGYETTASGLIVLRRLSVTPGPRRTVFFDRDGVLNVDRGYVGSREDFEWRRGAVEAVELAHGLGFWTVVVTNQSGIGRGYFSSGQVVELLRWIMEVVPLDLVLACPHGPDDGCPCRKPKPFMLEHADQLLGVVKSGSFLVGDMDRDVAAGRAFGVPGYLVDDSPLDTFIAPLLSSAGTS